MNLWEHDYLQLCYDAMAVGRPQATRVGPAMALYGRSLEVHPGPGRFPLLTTRRMAWKPVLGELAAFLRGSDLNRDFVREGCLYWGANARAWAKNEGVPDADLRVGKIYGYQWRNFGGVDQLTEVRRQLRFDQGSRRILLSAWNPADLDDMCLPPCHIMAQFHVDGNELSCSVYMRSVDLALGLPSDIVLYYALMVALAQDASLLPTSLYFHFGNAHVYGVHEEKLRAQVRREPREMPFMLNFLQPVSTQSLVLDLDTYQPMEAIRYELLV